MEDIYDDLENYSEVNSSEKLQVENADLKCKIQVITETLSTLQTDYDKLKAEYKKLEVNYSSLLRTAKAEIERKTQLITSLNAEKDQLILHYLTDSTNKYSYNKKHEFKDKSDLKNKNTDCINKDEKKEKSDKSKCKTSLNKDTHVTENVEPLDSSHRITNRWTKSKHSTNEDNFITKSHCKDINKPEKQINIEYKDNFHRTTNKQNNETIESKEETIEKKVKHEPVTKKAQSVINRQISVTNLSEHCSSPKFSSDDNDCQQEDEKLTHRRSYGDKFTNDANEEFNYKDNGSCHDERLSNSQKSSTSSYHKNRYRKNYDSYNKSRSTEKYETSYNHREGKRAKSPSNYKRRPYQSKNVYREGRDNRYHRQPDRRRILESPPHDTRRQNSYERKVIDNNSTKHVHKTIKHKLDSEYEVMPNHHYNKYEHKTIKHKLESEYEVMPNNHYNKYVHKTIKHKLESEYEEIPNHTKYENKTVKHKLELEYEEVPQLKRQKYCNAYRDCSNELDNNESNSDTHSLNPNTDKNKTILNAESPIIEVASATTMCPELIKENEMKSSMEIQDPRLLSDRYMKILDDNNKVSLSIIQGRSIELKQLTYHDNYASNDSVSKNATHLSEDLLKEIYMDVDSQISIESGELIDTEVNDVEDYNIHKKFKISDTKNVPETCYTEKIKPLCSSLDTDKFCVIVDEKSSTHKKLKINEDSKESESSINPLKGRLNQITYVQQNNKDSNETLSTSKEVVNSSVEETSEVLCKESLNDGPFDDDGHFDDEPKLNDILFDKASVNATPSNYCAATVADDLELSDETIDYNEIGNNSNLMTRTDKLIQCSHKKKIYEKSNKEESFSNTNNTPTKFNDLFGDNSLITPEDLNISLQCQSISVLDINMDTDIPKVAQHYTNLNKLTTLKQIKSNIECDEDSTNNKQKNNYDNPEISTNKESVIDLATNVDTKLIDILPEKIMESMEHQDLQETKSLEKNPFEILVTSTPVRETSQKIDSPTQLNVSSVSKDSSETMPKQILEFKVSKNSDDPPPDVRIVAKRRRPILRKSTSTGR